MSRKKKRKKAASSRCPSFVGATERLEDRCEALTAEGTQCTRMGSFLIKGMTLCAQHMSRPHVRRAEPRRRLSSPEPRRAESVELAAAKRAAIERMSQPLAECPHCHGLVPEGRLERHIRRHYGREPQKSPALKRSQEAMSKGAHAGGHAHVPCALCGTALTRHADSVAHHLREAHNVSVAESLLHLVETTLRTGQSRRRPRRPT